MCKIISHWVFQWSRINVEVRFQKGVLTWKIGASGSLLIATMVLESFIPDRCWMAPEMPTATYSCGATTLPTHSVMNPHKFTFPLLFWKHILMNPKGRIQQYRMRQTQKNPYFDRKKKPILWSKEKTHTLIDMGFLSIKLQAKKCAHIKTNTKPTSLTDLEIIADVACIYGSARGAHSSAKLISQVIDHLEVFAALHSPAPRHHRAANKRHFNHPHICVCKKQALFICSCNKPIKAK